MREVRACTDAVLDVETGAVHHEQLDHLEAVDPHRVVHASVAVLKKRPPRSPQNGARN